MADKELTWNDTEAIGIALCREHPELDPDSVSSQDMHRFSTQLPEFKDDPAAFDNHKLESIRTAWAMEFLDRTQ